MAAVTGGRKKLVAEMILPIGGMALKRCAVHSTSHLAASSSYASSMVPSMPSTSQLHPQIHPFLPSGGSLELMAVPKKKVTPHKKGLRNGPKALKPVPVIVRCKSCGRVKLPHFYCCSGDRGNSGKSEQPK